MDDERLVKVVSDPSKCTNTDLIKAYHELNTLTTVRQDSIYKKLKQRLDARHMDTLYSELEKRYKNKSECTPYELRFMPLSLLDLACEYQPVHQSIIENAVDTDIKRLFFDNNSLKLIYKYCNNDQFKKINNHIRTKNWFNNTTIKTILENQKLTEIDPDEVYNNYILVSVYSPEYILEMFLHSTKQPWHDKVISLMKKIE